jgi:hypothetical protein
MRDEHTTREGEWAQQAEELQAALAHLTQRLEAALSDTDSAVGDHDNMLGEAEGAVLVEKGSETPPPQAQAQAQATEPCGLTPSAAHMDTLFLQNRILQESCQLLERRLADAQHGMCGTCPPGYDSDHVNASARIGPHVEDD